MLMISTDKLKKLYHLALCQSLRQQGGMGGQAITFYTCLECGTEQAHSNTNVPVFCRDCVKKIRQWLSEDSAQSDTLTK